MTSRSLTTRQTVGLFLPGVITPTYLDLPSELPFETWQHVGDVLLQADTGSKWWIGDWLNFGEVHYGEKYSQELQDKFGVGYEALRSYAWMSRQFEMYTRVYNVSWAHHRVVASEKKFTPKERTAYLRAARLYGLNSDQFDAFVRQHEKKKRMRAATNGMPAPPPYLEGSDIILDSVQVAEIADLHLPPGSFDMIFTDPPYHDEYRDLYGQLGHLAAHVLKPGGYLMVYAGKMYLPDLHLSLGSSLEYVWTYCAYEPGNQTKINKCNLFEEWRPILAYKKPGPTETREWLSDTVRAKREKENHDWQQGIDPALKYIAAYTLPGQIVLDPFVGGGTTPVACKELKRHFVAFDKDESAVKMTISRLNGYIQPNSER